MPADDNAPDFGLGDPNETSPTLTEDARWAVVWLVGIIDDGRVHDLKPDGGYVRRARAVLARLDRSLGSEGTAGTSSPASNPTSPGSPCA